MADIARIEERLDRVAAGNTSVSDSLGGIAFQNMTEVMEFSKLMALSGNAVPKHLQGNPGMCLAVCIQAMEWRFSPFAVANKSYEVQNRLSFESQLVHAVIEQRAPIIGRLRHRFEGEGDERICIVWATLRETTEILEYRSPTFGKIQPKNSPLWKTKPDLQQYYNTSRDFCRAYFPDVLLGVYSEDELRDHHGPDHARDINDRPSVGSRLKAGKGGRGFNASHVEQHTRGVIEETPSDQHNTEAQREAGNKQSPPASAADEALASAKEADTSGSGTTDKPHGEPQSSQQTPDSSQSSAPPDETDAPATEQASHPMVAGQQSQESSRAEHADDEGAGDGVSESTAPSPSAGLPQGWQITYAAALRRAQKPISLPKYATAYWAQYGGWAAHKDTDDGKTAIAIYDAFANNFGNREQIELLLREMI